MKIDLQLIDLNLISGVPYAVRYTGADITRIEALEKLMLEGVKLPPIKVRPIPGTDRYIIIDGSHRVTAGRNVGWLTIEAIVL